MFALMIDDAFVLDAVGKVGFCPAGNTVVGAMERSVHSGRGRVLLPSMHMGSRL